MLTDTNLDVSYVRMSVPNIPNEALARAAWVQYQLKLRGLSLSRLARQHGWTPRVLSTALRVPSYPQEVALAEALELTVPQLFPDRYAADGTRLHIIRRKPSTGRRSRPSRTEEAA